MICVGKLVKDKRGPYLVKSEGKWSSPFCDRCVQDPVREPIRRKRGRQPQPTETHASFWFVENTKIVHLSDGMSPEKQLCI
jgi:hypothetical protein